MRGKIFSLASWRAKHEDSRALGEAAALVGYLTMALKIAPNLERACAFASEQLEGRMGQDLKRQIAECHLRFHSSADEALLKFSQRWGQSFPEFGQAIHLVRGSVSELSRLGRERSLDRALQLVLQGTRQRVREFSSNLSLPTLLIYSLGILLPLVFVVILPVLSVIDLQVGLVQIALIYCVFLPLLVHLLSSNVLSKRPVIFQHLDHSIEPNRWYSAVKALAVSVPVPVLCFLFAPAPDVTTLASLWGIGLGLSAFLYFDSAPGYRRREEIVQMEREFGDALLQLGNRVSEGRPAEEALEHVAVAMSGSKIAQVFRAASVNVRLGGMSLRAALFDESRGALRRVYSSMIRGTLKMLLDLIEKSTRTAGEAILRTAQHLRELNEAKEEMRRSMAEVVTSMRAVAIFFAPLIVSIAARLQGLLSEKMPSLDLFPATGISPAAFLFVLGLYTIILTIILTNYVVEIELGGDSLAKRMALAGAVPVALVVFTVGAVLGAQMVDFLFLG